MEQQTAAPGHVHVHRAPSSFRAQVRTMVDEDAGTVVLLTRNAAGDEVRIDLAPDQARHTGEAMVRAADRMAAIYAERGLRVVTSP